MTVVQFCMATKLNLNQVYFLIKHKRILVTKVNNRVVIPESVVEFGIKYKKTATVGWPVGLRRNGQYGKARRNPKNE